MPGAARSISAYRRGAVEECFEEGRCLLFASGYEVAVALDGHGDTRAECGGADTRSRVPAGVCLLSELGALSYRRAQDSDAPGQESADEQWSVAS